MMRTENKVVELRKQGYTTEEIAETLFLSESTIRNYLVKNKVPIESNYTKYKRIKKERLLSTADKYPELSNQVLAERFNISVDCVKYHKRKRNKNE